MSGKIKVGIWGLGRAGVEMHTAELLRFPEEFEIVAACDAVPDVAAKYAQEHNVKTYTDPAAFLADKSMELVAVATFSLCHVENARQALEAGFSVVLEKPVAQSRAEAEVLAEFDRKHPGRIFCRQNRRFESCFQHVREIIASGILGKIHTIKLQRNQFTRRDDWQTLKKNGGGQLGNWGSHILDQALQFLNYEVKSVWSELRVLAAQGDAEDCVKVILQGKNGCTVDVEIFGANAFPGNVCEVYGTRGALISPDEKDIKLNYIEPDFELKKFNPVDGRAAEKFYYAANEGIPWRRMTIMTEPKHALRPEDFYHYVYESMREGKPFPIKFQEILALLELIDQIKAQSELYNPNLKK